MNKKREQEIHKQRYSLCYAFWKPKYALHANQDNVNQGNHASHVSQDDVNHGNLVNYHFGY
mgnify:FL=1